ncbi:MAG: gliding motility lipoprotein GldH [Prevotella sp.]|nr:gliding motility lipoprotein GldH [Prevotella sp.]
MRMTNTSKVAALAAVCLTAALLQACYQSTAYFRYFSTNIKGWERDTVLHYHVPAVKEGGFYAEEIGVRTSRLYPFKQLSLVVNQKVISTSGSHANVVNSDTIVLDIYDEEGNLRGKGVDLYQLVVPFKGIRLQEGDSIEMAIHHNMRRFALEGIADVGFKVTKAYSE